MRDNINTNILHRTTGYHSLEPKETNNNKNSSEAQVGIEILFKKS